MFTLLIDIDEGKFRASDLMKSATMLKILQVGIFVDLKTSRNRLFVCLDDNIPKKTIVCLLPLSMGSCLTAADISVLVTHII